MTSISEAKSTKLLEANTDVYQAQCCTTVRLLKKTMVTINVYASDQKVHDYYSIKDYSSKSVHFESIGRRVFQWH